MSKPTEPRSKGSPPNATTPDPGRFTRSSVSIAASRRRTSMTPRSSWRPRGSVIEKAAPMPTSVSSLLAMRIPFCPASENGSISGPSSSGRHKARRSCSAGTRGPLLMAVRRGWR